MLAIISPYVALSGVSSFSKDAILQHRRSTKIIGGEAAVGKPTDTFSAEKMFAALDDVAGSGRQIIGLVRPHPENSQVIQVAHPRSPDEWHDLDEAAVLGFAPLRPVRAGNDAKLVRLFLREDGDHPLSHFAEATHDTAEVLHRLGAKSIMTGGAQYCYYDAQGRYVCIPI